MVGCILSCQTNGSFMSEIILGAFLPDRLQTGDAVPMYVYISDGLKARFVHRLLLVVVRRRQCPVGCLLDVIRLRGRYKPSSSSCYYYYFPNRYYSKIYLVLLTSRFGRDRQSNELLR